MRSAVEKEEFGRRLWQLSFFTHQEVRRAELFNPITLKWMTWVISILNQREFLSSASFLYNIYTMFTAEGTNLRCIGKWQV